jgi:hypothetical protein
MSDIFGVRESKSNQLFGKSLKQTLRGIESAIEKGTDSCYFN